MNLAGFTKTSFIDYPGKISSIFFTVGCNFNCVYCHNWQIISGTSLHSKEIEKKGFEWLEKKKDVIEGVSITGGEPCLQKDLISFISLLKEKGFLVKLDTNGSFPEVVKEVLEKKLIDYIAMDVKAPFSKYSEIVGVDIDISLLKKSIRLIMESGIDYEFRTTAYPLLSLEDYKEISLQIKLQF